MIFALLLIAADVDPADWTCADNLIEKNFSAKVEAAQLAARIADECARPFVYRPEPGVPDLAALKLNAENLYLTQSLSFKLAIQSKIEKRRRAVAIPLKK